MRVYAAKVAIVFVCLGMAATAIANEPWKIDRIDVDKVCYKPGQTAKFATHIVYSGKKASMKAEVSVDVYSELDRKEPVYKEVKEFKPNEKYPLRATWKSPQDRKWGHEVRVTVTPVEKNAKPIVRSGYFAVGRHSWQVGHWTSCCNTGMLNHPEEVQKLIIKNYRRWHYSSVDYFSWMPSGWETMAPQEDDWVSGQTGYVEKKAILQQIVKQAHERGIEVTSYYQNRSWGPAGVEFIRTHPEWWNFDRFGKPFPKNCSFDVAKLDKMRKREKLSSLPWCSFTTGLIWREDMEAHLFDQLKKSVEMFGWDGFRSDGLPIPANVYDRHGKYHQVVKGDETKAHIAWIKRLRKWMRENISEDCFLHFNSGSVSYGLEKTDRELFQERARGSYALWEGAYLASMPGSSLNNMKTFARYLHEEVEAAREVGGYRHVGWMSSVPELLEATATACGAQVDYTNHWDAKPSPATWGPYPWRSFTFRFSRYFWGPDLKRIKNTDELFDVSAPENIWWKTFAQERIEPDGTRCIALHLINLPDGYPSKKKATKERKNIPVTLRLGKSKPVDAFALSSREGYPGFVRKLSVEQKGGDYQVVVPNVKVWTVVVFRISK